MSEERRPIKSWGSRLGGEGEPLTLEEASLLAALSQADRLLECVTALQDIQMRLTRLELFVSAVAPGYEGMTRRPALSVVQEDAS